MRSCWLALVLVASLAGQDYRHNVTVAGGAGIPLFARSRSIWEDSPLIGAGYGFRFSRHLQGDFAFTRVISPADKQFDPLEPIIEHENLGGGRIDSYLMGGRYLFHAGKSILVSAGMGVVHERFTPPQLRRSGSAFLHESGWGAYALGGVSWAIDKGGHFHIGIIPRLEMVQARQAWLHRNRWLLVPVEFGFRF